MKSKVILIICICILFLFLVGITIAGVLFLTSRNSQNPAQNNNPASNQNNNNPSTSEPVTEFPQSDISLDSIPSIRKENVPFKNAPQSAVPELDLGKKTMELLINTNWDGRNNTPFPLTVNSYGQDYINDLLQDENERAGILTIPDELERYYTSSEAQREIETLIFQIRGEFMEYIEQKGVNQKYIDEINNNALPNDPKRLQYKGINDPNSPPSVTTVLSDQPSPTDHSKREFIIYAVDVYNGTRQFTDSGLVSNEDPKMLRDMGLRVLMYHEFAHILQKAVDTVHSRDPKSKSSWLSASRSLQNVTDRYDRSWGSDAITGSRNRDVSNESQADGLSFEMITTLYDMSDSQKQLYWEFKFGRLEEAKQNWIFIMDTLESKYPEFWADTLGGKVYRDIFSKADSNIKTPFLRITTRLDALGPYGGYLQPMRPEHTQEFWDYLKN